MKNNSVNFNLGNAAVHHCSVRGLPYHQFITSLHFPEHCHHSTPSNHKPVDAFMSSLLLPSTYTYGHARFPFKPNRFSLRTVTVRAAVSSPEKRGRKKKQTKDDQTTVENGLRFSFMEELMDRARNRDSNGVSDVIYDMIAAGLSPGPRSFHGLVVSHALNGNEEAAVC